MEAIIQDFSGGMNASVAVDKLKDNECLLAESVRFDEQGNVLISGANTAQNTAAISDGTSSNIHSLFFDSALGCVAGVGQAVYLGGTPATLSSSTATNAGGSKMSFGAAQDRIYMDAAGVAYFKYVTAASLITVDWTPPPSFSALAGPTVVGSGSDQVLSGHAPWTNPNFVTSTSTLSAAKVTFSSFAVSDPLNATMGTNSLSVNTASTVSGIQVTALCSGIPGSGQLNATLLKAGIPIGQVKFAPLVNAFSTATFGGINDLWGNTWAPADVNGGSFGVQFQIASGISGTVAVCDVAVTVYGGAGGTVAAAGAGGALTGTYSWKIAFVAANGEESDASGDTGSVALTSAQGTLTAIPIGDSRTVARNIYRKGATLTAHYLVGTIRDNISTTYSDNMTDLGALTTAVILAGDTVGDQPNSRFGGAARGKYPCLHYERVFWADQVTPNRLLWSKPLNGFAYPSDFESLVGDSKPITGIISYGGDLIIFKSDSIWRLSGTDENTFQLSRTLSPVGTDWPFSIVLAGGGASGFYFTGRVLFANTRGIWAFNGYSSNKLTPKLDLWFRQDNRTNKSVFGTTGFNPPEISNSAVTAGFQAASDGLFYRLAYAEAGQAANNAVLVFDLERGSISKRAQLLPSMVAESVGGYFYAGTSAGIIVKLDDWNAAGNGLGGNVNMDFQDKYRDMGLRGSRFGLFSLEFLIATNGQSVTPTIYFDDGTASEALAAITTSGTVPARVSRPLATGPSRYCRNFSVRLNYNGNAVNSSGTPNIQLVHFKANYDPRGARARTGEKPS